MSKYTTEVRFICETLAGYNTSQGYGKVEEIINKSWDKIFDFDFPIFDEDYRKVLCTKIIRHYYTREIGLETVGLWKLKLSTKMQEIMPYYNKLYETESLKYNPLYDADYSKSGNVNDEGEDNRNSNGTRSVNTNIDKNVNSEENGTRSNTRWDIYSDTPQGALTNVDNETYLTDARKITDSETTHNEIESSEDTTIETGERNTNAQEGNYSTTKEYVEHIVGKFPGRSSASLMVEYRNSLLNIDMQVIDDLSKLFMLIW